MPRMINNDAKNDSRRAISAAVSANIDQYNDYGVRILRQKYFENDSERAISAAVSTNVDQYHNPKNELERAISRMIENEQFQLRYLQTLTSISAESNSTIVFPVPVSIMIINFSIIIIIIINIILVVLVNNSEVDPQMR